MSTTLVLLDLPEPPFELVSVRRRPGLEWEATVVYTSPIGSASGLGTFRHAWLNVAVAQACIAAQSDHDKWADGRPPPSSWAAELVRGPTKRAPATLADLAKDFL